MNVGRYQAYGWEAFSFAIMKENTRIEKGNELFKKWLTLVTELDLLTLKMIVITRCGGHSRAPSTKSRIRNHKGRPCKDRTLGIDGWFLS